MSWVRAWGMWGKGARSTEAPILIGWLGSGLVWDGRTRKALGEPGLLGGSDLWWPYYGWKTKPQCLRIWGVADSCSGVHTAGYG